MPDGLVAVLRKAPYTPEKLTFAWRLAVGPPIARVTTVTLEGNVLRVHVNNAVWRREVERSAGLISRRLADLLGPDVVRCLDVVVE